MSLIPERLCFRIDSFLSLTKTILALLKKTGRTGSRFKAINKNTRSKRNKLEQMRILKNMKETKPSQR